LIQKVRQNVIRVSHSRLTTTAHIVYEDIPLHIVVSRDPATLACHFDIFVHLCRIDEIRLGKKIFLSKVVEQMHATFGWITKPQESGF